MNGVEVLWLLGRDAFWSGVASLGFAILFNVPVRTLLACALCGASGHAVRTLLMELGIGIELATLVGAALVGVFGELFARRWHAPASVFTVPGVIPMIPGTFAYGTMIGLVELASGAGEAVLLETAVNAIKTLLILASLASGIAAASMLFQRHHKAKEHSI
jgi:uncharacterized membrane protein YjjB (DUF3815 family)